MATDEEVEAAKDRVIELRAKLDDALAGGEEHLRAVANDITITNLAAEEARLQAELDTANQQKKVTVVRQGAAAPLGTAKEQMVAAIAHQDAVAKELTAAKKANSTATPTDADSTNTTTTAQADNKADKTEGAK